MSRLLLLFDGNAILHRAYHALPPLKSPDGTPTGAVHGMFALLIKLIQNQTPTDIAYAFDTKEPTFRNELLKEYQAQRQQVDDDLIIQFGLAREMLEYAKISYFEKPGFEADDLIGTLSKKYDGNVLIVTGDRDIMQLVDDRVRLLYPSRLSQGEDTIFDKEAVKNKLGVWPNQVVDYKALVGDPSDNYKGVLGVGEKTAISLLEKYGSLDSIYNNIDQISGAVKSKLEKGRDSAVLSKKLATILKDVEIDASLDLSSYDLSSEKLIHKMEELGMKSLPKKSIELSKKLNSLNQTSLW